MSGPGGVEDKPYEPGVNGPPAPGSPEATKIGCTCPILDNAYGRGYMGVAGVYAFSMNCTVHQPRIRERLFVVSDAQGKPLIS